MFRFWEFLIVFLLMFALFSVLLGMFTAYFGAGKSRKIGSGLILVGLIIGILVILPQLRSYLPFPPIDLSALLIDVVVILAAAAAGAGLGLLLFLGAIMKS